jgi:dTDP-4-amino-4,6-dideoxygalactose transaminase
MSASLEKEAQTRLKYPQPCLAKGSALTATTSRCIRFAASSTGPRLYSVAEAAYERLITLPIFPRMSDNDADNVIAAVHKVVEVYKR